MARRSSLEQAIADAWRAFPHVPVKEQVKIGRYRCDFVAGRLIVEVQGTWTHSSPADKERDARRASYLHERGYEVCFITEQEIREKSPLGLIDHLDTLLREREHCCLLPVRHH